MKAEVKERFLDKFTDELYEVGTVVDFDTERVADLVSRGLVTAVAEAESGKAVRKKRKKAE